MSDLAESQPMAIRSAVVVADLARFLPDILDRQEEGLPKHVRLQRALLEAITDGIVCEGDKLPSETELTAILPFSLGTVQRALRSLTDDGLIVRKAGVGTIVRLVNQPMKQPLHCRFSGADGVFLPVFPRMFDRAPVDAPGPWRDALGGQAKIVRLDRRVEIGGAFALVAHFYVDATRFPMFARRPIADLHTENFKSLMQAEKNVNVSRLEHRLGFGTADGEIARQIGVALGTPIMQIAATAYNAHSQAIYFQEFFIPPNKLNLSIESHLTGVS